MKPSVVIAADKSGSGKTTLTCGLIYVLKKRGLKVQSFKCGPDYIDPMFHRKVLGVPSANLDSFFVSREMLRMLYAERAEMAEISVTEGVMGYYDGLGGVSVEASTWEIADIIQSPTVLIMDCKGASVSVAALIRGMLDFPKHAQEIRDRCSVEDAVFLHEAGSSFGIKTGNSSNEESSHSIENRYGRMGTDDENHDSGIRGVILNRVSPMFYERLKGVIEDNCPGIRVLGYMPEMKDRRIPSRHLGLVEPGDMEDFTSWIEAVGEQIEKTVSIDGILDIAKTTKSGKTMDESRDYPDSVSENTVKYISELRVKNKVKLGIAEDEAFNFYYQENRELLEKMGAEIVSFSPLHDEKLPEDLDGILIGGGYPEIYKEKLSANVSMREALAASIKNGIPVIAECGGYMYLNHSIIGEPGLSADEDIPYEQTKNRIEAGGQETISSESGKDREQKIEGTGKTVLGTGKQFEMCGVFPGDACKKERLVRFGYVSAETKVPGLFGDAGTVLKGHEFHRYDCEYNGEGFRLRKPKAPNRVYDGIFYGNTMSSGWPHFYYYSNPKAIFNFMKCCERYHFEKSAQKKWDGIAKPIDSLGILEREVTKLCGIQRTLTPSIEKKALVVLCADHGCVREGVTQTDSSVTRKVADSFVKGMTTTSIFAKGNNVDVYTVDVGMTGSRYSYMGKPYECKAELRRSDDGKTADSNVKNHPAPENSLNFQKVCQDVPEKSLNFQKLCQGVPENSLNFQRLRQDVPENSLNFQKLRQDVVNDRRLQDGSGNIAVEPAMSPEVGEKALRLGMDIVRELKESGYDIIATGEMGIGNTTPTAALLAYFMESKAEEAVGYGAGLSEEGLRRKQDVVRRALRRLVKKSGLQEGEFQAETDDFSDSDSKSGDDSNRLNAESIENNKNDVSTDKVKTYSAETAKEALFEIGGLEIAVMSGMFLGGVRYEVPVVIDGIISTAAALSAYMIDERVADYAFASHISKEKLARKALEKMGLPAIIDAEMSLGEGSGAVLLMPILSSAVEAFNRMGSFSDMEVEAYHRFSH